MHESLREVAQQLVGVRVDLLGIEANIAGEVDQVLHERGGLIEAADPGERVREPKRAAEEGALDAPESVRPAVAGEQWTAPEITP